MDGGLLRRTIIFALTVALGVFCCASFIHSVTARDNGQWNDIDQKTRQWFKDLKSGNGISCCSDSDGLKIEDIDYYENTDGTYQVHIPSHPSYPGSEVIIKDYWTRADKEHTISPPERKVKYAIVWPYNYVPPQEDVNGVYCFMPGTGY